MADEWLPGRPNGGGRPDDPIEEFRRLWGRFRSTPGASGGGAPRLNLVAMLGILMPLWLLSGIFIVAPDERGIVLRFGRVVREAEPGPGYHLPWPVEQVLRPSVTQIRKEEFGFRTIDVGPPARYTDDDTEALMVTGDENIVKLQFIVQYRIRPGASGATDYLFHVRNPEETVRDAAEAAMREVMGRNEIDDALTEGKDRIQTDTQALLQTILDRYEAGVEIATVKLQDVDPPDQVADAFKDVISAQQDKERLINESHGYANDVVPKARGQAAQLLNEAEGYAQAKMRDAEGAAARFVALHDEYAKAKDVTRVRLYLETMEEVLARTNMMVLDESAARQLVPYLPLDKVARPGEPLPELEIPAEPARAE